MAAMRIYASDLEILVSSPEVKLLLAAGMVQGEFLGVMLQLRGVV
jgi:hypothetical protein